jgi:formylmethanofuran dehydrogenase subunit E
MLSFDELLKESSSLHGHLCAGQILGVRMAMLGCREVGIAEPKGCKKLMVYVEMDRCATDAIQAVTGCSLGKRTLKFLDYGKMAATFINVEKHAAVRVLAKDEARSQVPLYVEDVANPRDAQKKAYAVMPEDVLFTIRTMSVQTPKEDMPGVRSERVFCEECGEGINFKRDVKLAGRTLCIPCARGSYLPQGEFQKRTEPDPKVLLVVGSKKVGKTTLIEKLIPELSKRGYRVGTVKHHHSEFPVEMDSFGTDSWRHREAGARSVVFVSPKEMAVFRETDEAASLKQVVANLKETDIVLVEGFHLESGPKVEVLSSGNNHRICKPDEDVLAVVGVTDSDASIRRFDLDSIEPLADLIEKEILGRPIPG